MATDADKSGPRQLIAGLSEGIILVEPDQRIARANDTAIAMHGVENLAGLNATVDAYPERFSLRYRNNRPAECYPIKRVVAGRSFRDVVVEITHAN